MTIEINAEQVRNKKLEPVEIASDFPDSETFSQFVERSGHKIWSAGVAIGERLRQGKIVRENTGVYKKTN